MYIYYYFLTFYHLIFISNLYMVLLKIDKYNINNKIL